MRACLSINTARNPCWRRLLRSICVCSRPMEPTCGLCYKYGEWILDTVSERGPIICRNQQYELSQYVHSLGQDDLWLWLFPNSFICSISLMRLGSTIAKFFRDFPKVACVAVDSLSREPDKSTMVIFGAGFHGRKANILTTY